MPSLLLTIAMGATAAEEDASEAAPFLISTEDGAYRITDWAPPPPAVVRDGDRTCRLALSLEDDAVRARARTCADAVRDEAVQTVESWTVTPLSQRLDDELSLAEVWFVYPARAGGTVRTWIRQHPDRQLTLPEGVDAVPYAVQAWAFLRYPEEVVDEAAPVTSCTIALDIDVRGFPEVLSVDGCDEPFRSRVEETLSAWRFKAPEVDGAPVGTGVVLEATFDPADPPSDEGERPSAESQALWANRQFQQMTREERLWFIRASLLGPPRDLGRGQVSVRLPPPPELGGRSERVWFDGPAAVRRPVRPLPDHPPRLLLGREGRPDIQAWELSAPIHEGLDDEQRCSLTVQVDSDRSVWAWAQVGACDEPVRRSSIQAVERWVLRHTAEDNPEARERFEVTLVYPTEGAAEVWLDEDLVRSPTERLPPHIHVYREATLTTRVPPRLPRRLLDGGLEEGICRFDVTVDRKGRPARIERRECPDAWAKYAQRAVRRYRWEPAAIDGEPHEGSDEVVIRFAD